VHNFVVFIFSSVLVYLFKCIAVLWDYFWWFFFTSPNTLRTHCILVVYLWKYYLLK
jgi:hypothetical protein